MLLSKVSISRLLSEKSASVFCVIEETYIEQKFPEMNRHRKGSIVVKKGSSVCGIFTKRDLFTQSLYAGRNPTVNHVLSL
jgi:CBS domain-containing protein